jgi:hypothetical protein
MFCPSVLELRLDALNTPAGVACSIFIRRGENAPSRAELRRAVALVPAKAQCVPHFFFFGPQVGERVWSRRNFAGNPRDNFNAGIGQSDSLARIIGE